MSTVFGVELLIMVRRMVKSSIIQVKMFGNIHGNYGRIQDL